jgi:hypothetical protein
MTEINIPQSKHPWETLGYEPVRGLMDRIISRYLRGQRKNMERFFRERGLLDAAERMRQIRLSRQGMLAKNRMFQEVLNEYAQRVNPQGATPQPASEAAADQKIGGLAVPDPANAVGTAHGDGNGPGSGTGLPEVASAGSAGVVIEE